MMSRDSLIFCGAALAVTLAVCTVGFRLAALPADAVQAASQPAPPETLPDIDIGGGFGKVSVIELIGFYMENPPAPKGGGGEGAPAAKRFGGC
ncbi:MAG TPA: hypothetical protein PKC23_01800 [Candidatus Desulfobacillus sp.]|nr:hypothetical protein [Candidatus Desulfobacillus sp.]